MTDLLDASAGFSRDRTFTYSRKVLDTGILPIINTAIAHKKAGIGMIGAGVTHPPIEAFDKAIIALAATFAAHTCHR
ncbi:hypothetical protein C3B61_09960 [Cryobacterium zongtaii]|uniref:Uncharacterized protein n=1 Tax=Cryobacterium zongtaii TaxID=1259217 RepID=A0A2S3ZG47_9MICO|nr:hypothetical protein [Cryobacterium zongtaii]POH65869.1 hypothetical protein C3B61_09960 [Cryobacterium zongtaii]